MADLPEATVTIDDEAGAFSGGTGYIVVMGCVEENDDLTPRVFSSTKALLAQHGYSPAVDYCAHHFEGTKKPVLFVGMPTTVVGVLGSEDDTGITGSSAVTVAAGTNGVLEEVDATLTVTTGGTIGQYGIVFTLSLDGGVTEKTVRLGTASSYTIPYVGIVINFGAGDLNAGDVYTFKSTAPMWDGDGIADARVALGEQLKPARSFMVIGDLPTDTYAGYVTSAVNAYETSNDRFVYARASVRDRLPSASMAKSTVTMTGTPTITFAEAGSSDTITRSTGSFIADGFAVDDVVTVSGAVASAGVNNVTGKVATVTALVLTFDGDTDLVNEGPITGVSIIGSNSLIFTTTTCTRSGGSWLDDGFAVGDDVTFSGTQSNNISVEITVLTDTVMTFASGGSAETIGIRDVTCTKGETMAAWVADVDEEFASVDGQKRIDLGLGRLRKPSPITGWSFRRPVQWAASVREYQHDLHIPCWRKSDGPLLDWSNEDADGNVAEFDERTDGGGLAGRFTCARTYSNGPSGAFIALSLTRASEGSLLSRTHNMAVANLACTIAQLETENAIGQVLVLKDDGTATDASLALIEERVNTSLQIALLQNKGEGQRASKAVWQASKTDVLNVPGAQLNGVLTLLLNGTLEKIVTVVKVQTAG